MIGPSNFTKHITTLEDLNKNRRATTRPRRRSGFQAWQMDDDKNMNASYKDWSERLVEEVRSRPSLYDTSHPDYKDRHHMDMVWNSVGAAMCTSAENAKRRWQNLRGSFSKCVSSKHINGPPRFYLKQRMSFLLPFMGSPSVNKSSVKTETKDSSPNSALSQPIGFQLKMENFDDESEERGDEVDNDDDFAVDENELFNDNESGEGDIASQNQKVKNTGSHSRSGSTVGAVNGEGEGAPNDKHSELEEGEVVLDMGAGTENWPQENWIPSPVSLAGFNNNMNNDRGDIGEGTTNEATYQTPHQTLPDFRGHRFSNGGSTRNNRKRPRRAPSPTETIDPPDPDLSFFQGLLPYVKELSKKRKRSFLHFVSNELFNSLNEQEQESLPSTATHGSN